MKRTVMLGLVVLLAGCSSESQLTLSELEANGFQKDQQQLYQMVNATDGWSGHWASDRVEVYLYENASSATNEAEGFASSVQDGNLSGWVELCQHRNVLLLSKGESACSSLKGLD
ncbi:MAG: putative lipoprotein [Idiomarinaceae bacterium HL-53]|nr:MAG: putative lipoprotein [Idiomarinaceae bacterium HL-53]CUS49065.1 hypothetical protein Ga0003345_2052 [Idiomarinaceae bacterium HL-53]